MNTRIFKFAAPAVAVLSILAQPALAQNGDQPYSNHADQNQQYQHQQYQPDNDRDHGGRMMSAYRDGYRAGYRAARHGDHYDDNPHFGGDNNSGR
jgi:hypothetical protein